MHLYRKSGDTYDDFSAATSSASGSEGLVPAPAAGDQYKLLSNEGWSDLLAYQQGLSNFYLRPAYAIANSHFTLLSYASGILATMDSSGDLSGYAMSWDATGIKPANAGNCGSSDYPWTNTYTTKLSSGGTASLVVNSASGTGYLQSAGTAIAAWSAAALYPAAAASYTLGLSALPWSTTYTNAIASSSSSGLTVNTAGGDGYLAYAGTNYLKWHSTNFQPLTSNAYTLGASGYSFTAAYVTKVTSSSGDALTLNAGSNTGYIATGNTNRFYWNASLLAPLADATYSLGSATYGWSTTYTHSVTAPSGVMTVGSADGAIAFSPAATNCYYMDTTAFRPIASATYACGSSAYPWLTTYTNVVSSGSGTTLTLNAAGDTGYLSVANTGVMAWQAGVLLPMTDAGTAVGKVGQAFSMVAANELHSSTGYALYLYGTSGSIVFNSGDTSVLNMTGTSFNPITSGGMTLGASGYVWGQIYSSSTAISTSDARKKTSWEDIPEELLDVWDKHVKIRSFRWIDQTMDQRRVVGVTAQQVLAAFDEAGVDWKDWHVLEEDDKGTYLVAYTEVGLIENAWERRRIARLEAKILALESAED